MHRMLKLTNLDLPLEQRYRFALASYNAGYGHVLDARKIARQIGKKRDKWFANVEDAIVLLEDPKYWQSARHGFCRGSEPRTYVQNIEKYYDVYSVMVPLGTHCRVAHPLKKLQAEYHCAVQPPSTIRCVPVTIAAAGEAR